MDISRENRPMRAMYCVEQTLCGCGAHQIAVIAAEDVLLYEGGYEFKRPVHIIVWDTDPDECPEPPECITVQQSAAKELKNDLILAFKGCGVEMSEEVAEQIDAALDDVQAGLRELYIHDHATNN